MQDSAGLFIVWVDGGNERLVMRVIRDTTVLAEVVNGELLFELPQLGFHFLEIRMSFALGVCERLLNHHELVEFM